MSTTTPQEISARIQKTTTVLLEEAESVMRETVAYTSGVVAGEAPGSLGHKLFIRVGRILGGVSGTIRPTQPYAGLVEHGTGLYVEHHHRITPATQHVLSTARASLGPFTPKGGETMFRRSVKGQKPNPFMERADVAAAPRAIELLAAGADHATVRLFP